MSIGFDPLGFIEDLFVGIGLNDNPHADDVTKAMEQAQKNYEAYRPQLIDARMNAMGSALGLFSPANRQLVKMYGPDAEIGWGNAISNPFPEPAPDPVEEAMKPAPPPEPPGQMGWQTPNTSGHNLPGSPPREWQSSGTTATAAPGTRSWQSPSTALPPGGANDARMASGRRK